MEQPHERSTSRTAAAMPLDVLDQFETATHALKGLHSLLAEAHGNLIHTSGDQLCSLLGLIVDQLDAALAAN